MPTLSMSISAFNRLHTYQGTADTHDPVERPAFERLEPIFGGELFLLFVRNKSHLKRYDDT